VTDSSFDDINRAVLAAEKAFESFGQSPPTSVAGLLEKIADEIANLGESLINTASQETGLTIDRLTGERTRTLNQLRMFAALVRQSSTRDPRFDAAMEDRKPARRPDIRRILVPIGPVAVWAASNFPLAFSVAGGDTASALAAGCPVVLKAHPGHPETSSLVASAVSKAVASSGLPAGVFSMLEGSSPAVSLALMRHPKIAAGAFTGSLRAGRALFDAACARPDPIPFFAEMGSLNPVFILPGALNERAATIAAGLAQSVNFGIGQLCTSPGLIVVQEDAEYEGFIETLRKLFEGAPAGKMLTPAIAKTYRDSVTGIQAVDGILSTQALETGLPGRPVIFETNVSTFLAHEHLRQEVFGPATIVVRCTSPGEMQQVAESLEGSLTATVQAAASDLGGHTLLLATLARKAGRLIHNGYPTGVEVCGAMHHGGPYPASSDARFTSVGTAAIARFQRPLCFQDFPQEWLPSELRDA
jgi:alpha-ketoglutaric semialdehyde dehydrogenase